MARNKGVEATPAEAKALAKLVDEVMRGYDDIGLDAESVDWKKTPAIVGRVVGFDRLQTEHGERRVMLLNSGGRSVMLWESASLRRLFNNAHVGDEVSVVTTGMVDLGKNKSLRTFKAGLKRAEPAQRGAGAPARGPAPAAQGVDSDIPF